MKKQSLFVVIHLHSPKEKYWGILQKYSPAGVWLSGINLKGFEEFINMSYGRNDSQLSFTTSFFPMYRVEKITLDESIGEIPSMKDYFETKTGKKIEEMIKYEVNFLDEKFFKEL